MWAKAPGDLSRGWGQPCFSSLAAGPAVAASTGREAGPAEGPERAGRTVPDAMETREGVVGVVTSKGLSRGFPALPLLRVSNGLAGEAEKKGPERSSCCEPGRSSVQKPPFPPSLPWALLPGGGGRSLGRGRPSSLYLGWAGNINIGYLGIFPCNQSQTPR